MNPQTMSLMIDFWGVRGSLPFGPKPQELSHQYLSLLHRFFQEGYTTPDQIADFISNPKIQALRPFGLATTCVEVISHNEKIIIDAWKWHQKACLLIKEKENI